MNTSHILTVSTEEKVKEADSVLVHLSLFTPGILAFLPLFTIGILELLPLITHGILAFFTGWAPFKHRCIGIGANFLQECFQAHSSFHRGDKKIIKISALWLTT